MDRLDCAASNWYFLLGIVLYTCFFSTLSSLMMPEPRTRMYRCTPIEFFDGTLGPDVGEAFAKLGPFKYQSIPMTSVSALHMMSGQANVYETQDEYRIDLSANLYVLDGDVLEKRKGVKHAYKAFMMDASGKPVLYLGQLQREGGGTYTLTYTSAQSINAARIVVAYTRGGETRHLIEGVVR